MQTRAGTLKPQLSGEAQYFSFVPTPLQQVGLSAMDEEFATLLAQTYHYLGVLDAISSRIPNMDLFISMYIRKEALLSSQIEGTQATLEDILDPQAETNQNLNVAEVIGYIRALHFAMEGMEKLPLCTRLLRETHRILLSGGDFARNSGIRGSEKNPGEFRRSQNWIGAGGSTIKTARYIPPSPEDMIPALDDLERFINDEGGVSGTAGDPLISAALIHYQFETIHPFLDGNGRIGRLLIILYLCEKKLLSKPALYISCYLKQNQREYYDRLNEVRKKGDYESWVRFFIRGIGETAADAIAAIDQLTNLRDRNTQKISGLGRSAKTAGKLYGYIEGNPIIEVGKTARDLGVSFNTVEKAIEQLGNLGILAQTGTGKRNRVFAYAEYLDILRKGTE
jgi:Fic family protein